MDIVYINITLNRVIIMSMFVIHTPKKSAIIGSPLPTNEIKFISTYSLAFIALLKNDSAK
jgi:hypothetical protein